MTRPWLVRSLIFALFAAAFAAAQVTIKVRSEEVRIDALVTQNRKPLLGLGSADFEVYDNGVPQKVEYVGFADIPIDAILTLDMSESVAGEKLVHLKAAGKAVLGGLKKEDRAALITFNYIVNLGAKLTTDFGAVQTAFENVAPAGNTSLIDASYAGLTVGESGAERSLLILFSDGLDTSSFLQSSSVLDAAKSGHSVVYAVSCVRLPKVTFLRDFCRLTGGSLFEVESTRNLEAVFLRILEEFRHRYLVCYVPQGVARTGWHALEVRVKRRNASIQARPGYLR